MSLLRRMERSIHTARYLNANWHACAIVAVVNNEFEEGKLVGTLFDWAAYMGGCPGDLREEDAVEFVAENGDKLSIEDAAYFFPYLLTERYRQ